MFGCWRAAALWTAAVLILAPELSAAQARPVTIDDLMTMPSFGEGSLSPDGQWGVYERRDGWAMSSRFDLSYWSGWTTSELWVFGMSDRRPPKRLLDASEGRGHVLGPWSPSGRRLLIYRLQGDRFEAGVVDVEDLSVRWTGLTPNLSATGATATWADDETLVLAVLDDLGLPWLMRQYSPPTSVSARWRRMAEGRTRTSTVVDTHDGVAGSDQAAQAARLVSWSVQSGEFRRLAEGRVLDFSMAPDGARIAVLTAGAPVPLSPETPLVQSAFPVRSRLSVVTLSSGKVVTPIQPLDIAPHLLSWRKDGGAVLVWSRRDDQIWSAGGLTAVSAHNGQVTRYLHDGLQPLVVGEAIDLLHGVRATWLGADPILYARTQDGRFDWWRLGGDRPKKLTASLTTAPATFSGADTDGLTFVADGAVWRLALSGTTVRLGPDQAVSAAGMATEKQVLRQRLNAPEPRDWSPVQTGRGDLAIVTSYGDEKTLGDPIAAAPDRLYAVSRSAAIISRSDRGATALWLLRAGRERQLDVVNLNMTSRSTATIVTVSHLDRYGRRTHSLLYLPPETPTSQIKGVVVSGYPGAASAGRAFQLDDFVVGVNPLVIASAGYAWLQAAAPDNPSAVGPADGYRESLDLAIAAARGLQPDLPWDRLAFHRSTRGAEPTNAGRQFLRRVDALLNGLRLAISDARAAGAGQSGHLRIGLTFSMLSDGLFNLIERFHGAHPAVTIEMVEGRAIDHLDAVADRRLDVAMLPEGMTVTGLDVSVLWRERLLIALPVNHPCAAAEVVCVADIPKAKLLISERDIGRSLFSEIARRHQAELEVDIQDAGAGLLLEQTRMGLGLTLLGSGVLSSLKSDGALVFRPLAFEREEPLIVAAAWSPGNDNPALRRFVSSAKRLAASSKSGD